MGNKASSSLKREELEELRARTHYDRKELNELYKQFTIEAPRGRINKADFASLTQQMGITDGVMSDLVFKAFDENGDQEIEFREFIVAMSTITRGDVDEKLEFAFNLYDLNSDGYITRDEMISIVSSLYRMLGDLVAIQGAEYSTPDALVDKIMLEMDTNRDGKLSLEEFKSSAIRDPHLITGLSLF